MRMSKWVDFTRFGDFDMTTDPATVNDEFLEELRAIVEQRLRTSEAVREQHGHVES